MHTRAKEGEEIYEGILDGELELANLPCPKYGITYTTMYRSTDGESDLDKPEPEDIRRWRADIKSRSWLILAFLYFPS